MFECKAYCNLYIRTPKLKSSPHGLYIVGDTRVTMVKTKNFEKEIFRNFQKLPWYGYISETWSVEGEIISNRRLLCYGELKN